MKRVTQRVGLDIVAVGLAAPACLEEVPLLETNAPTNTPEQPTASGGAPSDMGEGGMGGSPVTFPPESPWHALAVGFDHSCLLSDDQLSCWGQNEGGTLGAFEGASSDVPLAVPLDGEFEAASAGHGFTCLLRSDQTLHCFGVNDEGQLGTGDTMAREVPTPVEGLGPVRQFDLGDAHGCAVTQSRELYCWGKNTERQLGIGGDPGAPPELSARRVESNILWSSVSAGQGATCAVALDGSLHCWGRNSQDGLGLGPNADAQYGTPQRVGSDTDYRNVEVGLSHSCATKTDGSLYCWGENENGQLALGNTENVSEPTRVPFPLPVDRMRTRHFNTCIFTADSDLYCAGWNDLGALGLGDTMTRLELTLVPPAGAYSDLQTGWQHNCVLDRDGAPLCVGKNTEGQLGDGTTMTRAEYAPVQTVGN